MSSTPPNPSARPARKGGWIACAVGLGLVAVMTVAVAQNESPYFNWDLRVSQAVQSTSSPGVERLMRAVSLAGDNLFLSGALVGLASLGLVALRARREAAFLLGVVLVGQGLKVGLKNLIGRPRPSADVVNVLLEDVKEVYSFPSGHTVHYVVFFGFLCYLTFSLVKIPWLRWPLLTLFGGLVVLVGVARVYLGAHWVSDVVGGYLLGGAVLAAGVGLYHRDGKPAG
ncbi:MAG: phosphatase PAP2 family protein [Gemmataceae bacterium]